MGFNSGFKGLNNLIFTASHSTKMSGIPFTEIGIAVGIDHKYGSDKLIIYAMNLVESQLTVCQTRLQKKKRIL